MPFIPALTSLRGIAAWWVVVYHFRSQLPPGWPSLERAAAQGYLAVDLFFVLSGFVIHLSAADRFRRLSWRAAASFMRARLARIYPLHLALSLAFLANPAAILLFSRSGRLDERYDPWSWVIGLGLVHNWGFTSELAWNIPSWSISAELFAYLLFPAAAFLMLRGPSRPVGAALLAGLLAAGPALLFRGAGADSLGDDIPRLGLGRCVAEFVLGMAVCRFFTLAGPPGATAQALCLGGFGALASLTWATGWPDYLLMPAAFGLLVLGLAGGVRAMAHPALLALGEISYSTYLVHYLVKDWVGFTLVGKGLPPGIALAVYLLATLAASSALYRLVEKPGRALARGTALRPSGSASPPPPSASRPIEGEPQS